MDTTTYLTELTERQFRAWPEEVPREPQYPFGEISLPEHLRRWAEDDPDRLALVFYGAEITFAQLDEMSDRFAGWLLECGVQPGDRVAVMLPNCPQFVIAMMGSLKVGAIHVPVSPLAQALELEHELSDAEPTVFLCLTDLRPLADPVLARLSVGTVATTSLADMLPDEPALPVPDMVSGSRAPSDWSDILASPRADWVAPDIDAVAVLNYTGGTTGLPKGCQHTQRNMLYTVVTSRNATPELGPDDRAVILVYIPIFWIGGENALTASFVFGTTLVLLTRWDADAWLQAVERYRVTNTGGTVDNYVELMEREDIGRYDLSSIKVPRAMSFVKVLTPEIRRRWQAVAGEHSLLAESAYGMTETHTLDTTTIGFQDGDRDLTTTPVFCGLPMPGTQFMIVDPETNEPLPFGQPGSILIRTPSLMKGYWRNEEATRRSISDDGWFDTGDKGFVDDDGCLHYLGRDKDMIKVNGMSVFPSEVESFLIRHPKISEAAVVAAPDERRGQIPVAFIRLTDGAVVEPQELETWARDNMSTYKVPRFRILDEFPLTMTGKIRKVDLAAQAADWVADQG